MDPSILEVTTSLEPGGTGVEAEEMLWEEPGFGMSHAVRPLLSPELAHGIIQESAV